MVCFPLLFGTLYAVFNGRSVKVFTDVVKMTGSPSQAPTHHTSLVSPQHGISREASWPVEGFGDLHLSGSEPRIFPGLVSRSQRRDSQRQGSSSEADNPDYGMRARAKTTLE